MWLVNWFKKRDEKEPPPLEERPRILAVAMSIDDRVSLGWIGDEYNWKIRFTQSPREAFALQKLVGALPLRLTATPSAA